MILDQLQRDLVVAAEREYAPRRRVPAVLLPVAAVLVLGVVVVFATRGAAPEREIAAPSPQRVTMSIPGVAAPVAFRVWVNGDGWLCQSVARSARRHGCANGFVLGSNLAAIGTPVHFGVSRHGRRFAVTGVVGPTVDALEVRAADGTRAKARISGVTLEVPVRIDRDRLTPEGRKLARTLPDVLRVRPYVVSLKLRKPPHDLQIAATIGRQTSFARIPPNVIPDASRPAQERTISLLARPRLPRDEPAVQELLRTHKSRQVAATARVARSFRGRHVFAYVNRLGDLCLVNYGTACGDAREAAGDRPMISIAFNQHHDGVEVVGLIHDGPTSVTLERADGSTRRVPVVNNVFVFRDENVVRLRWEGLTGPVSHELGENPVRP